MTDDYRTHTRKVVERMSPEELEAAIERMRKESESAASTSGRIKYEAARASLEDKRKGYEPDPRAEPMYDRLKGWVEGSAKKRELRGAIFSLSVSDLEALDLLVAHRGADEVVMWVLGLDEDD